MWSISMSGSAAPDRGVRPRPELLPVVRRRAEHLGDQPGGQRRGDLLGELVVTRRVDVVEDALDDLAHLGLQQSHLAAGEPGVDELAELPVPRRVGEDQVALLHRLRLAGSGIVMPFVDVNRPGLPETKRTSSYLVSAQKFVTSFHTTGVVARSSR